MATSNLPSVLRTDPRPFRDWSCLDLAIAWNTAHSELGDALLMRGGPDKDFWVTFLHDHIAGLKDERERRERARQPEYRATQEEARCYTELFRKRVKESIDLREHIARDLGYPAPLDRLISSPLRDNDRTPSFSVTATHWRDFGTDEGGDVIAWRMRWHGVSFTQALESLAAEAGIELPERAPRPVAITSGIPASARRSMRTEGRRG